MQAMQRTLSGRFTRATKKIRQQKRATKRLAHGKSVPRGAHQTQKDSCACRLAQAVLRRQQIRIKAVPRESHADSVKHELACARGWAKMLPPHRRAHPRPNL
eukprot:6194466-Pleurochrysis_carterae.AAC.3